jgi:hypothetical protein
MKRRIRKKKIGRAKHTEKALLKAIRRNEHVRGNVFSVPEVKKAMRRHDESLMITPKEVRTRGTRSFKRRQKRR